MRTRFDLIRPGLREHVENNQRKQENNFHANRKTEFETNDLVIAKDFSKKNWRSAEIEEKIGYVIYNVRTDDNKLWVRHIDQLKPSAIEKEESENAQKVVNEKSILSSNIASSEPNIKEEDSATDVQNDRQVELRRSQKK